MNDVKHDLWVATHNKGKIKEFQTLFEDGCFELKMPDYSKVPIPEETGSTFEENALIKLKSFQKYQPSSWILTEDSGIEVEALDGRPGIHSAYYQGENVAWVYRLECLLKEMKNVPWDKRGAQMVSVVLLGTPQGKVLKTKGIIRGHIAEKIQGTQGFAYDFVFIPDGEKQTIAELGLSYKNQNSHRARAIQQLKLLMKELDI